jgi:integrase
MNNRRTMGFHVKRYLKQRRALGFILKNPGRLLLDFARFMDRTAFCRPLTIRMALRWVNLLPRASRHYRAYRLSAVRCFARYLAVRDERTEIPPPRLLGRMVLRMQPHIYDDVQLRQLVDAADKLPPLYPMRPKTYSTLLSLLICTGMRISEVLKLTKTNVDLEQGILRIENAKFHKTRLVPLHPSATQALRLYARACDRDPLNRRSEFFFVADRGRAVSHLSADHTFRSICNQLAISSNGDMPRPRIHDLRHTFACRRLLAWHKQGVDIDHAIAALSTYLGHSSIANTYWYLTGTRQLMGMAGACFERFAAPKNGRQP